MKQPTGRVKAKVTVQAVKIHGPNSPDVLSGKVAEGHREEIAIESAPRTVELSEEDARELLGDEIVNEWLQRSEEK
jgi:hypothetical protein